MSATVGLIVDVAVDVLGLFGACLLAVPALRDLSYREIVGLLRPDRTPVAFPRAGELAANLAEADMLKFRPGDRRCIVGRLSAIAASYLLHLMGVILRELSP
jgi:hypothetical protein